ncbi:DUF4373 domain-containing protein [Candidatus Pacearchaeota archaeon]|nr:DUF4373 domain-containing protein [Candidatus Pacearchaeota archaeon]
MAGRKNKNTVDFFPHFVKHGRTVYILESKYGNDGYACLFKIFELLGDSENHFYDARNPEDFEFLCAKIGCKNNKCIQILNTMSSLGSIHKELWENRIIWSGNFIDNVQIVYERRKRNCMNFCDLCKHLLIKCKHKYDINGNSVNTIPHSRVE